MMKKLCFVLSLLSFVLMQAQNSNSYASTQISILTIGPGTSLNDAFGHNGIRVKTAYMISSMIMVGFRLMILISISILHVVNYSIRKGLANTTRL